MRDFEKISFEQFKKDIGRKKFFKINDKFNKI